MLSSLTRFNPGWAGGMAGSFTAMREWRTIISQLFVTLSDRLLAVAHAETLSNSAGMVHEFEAGTGERYTILYPFAVGILRRLAPFIGEDKFGIRVGINFEIKNTYFLIQIRVSSVWYSVSNFSHNWAIYKNEAPGTFLAKLKVRWIVNTLSFERNWMYAASIYE